MEGSPRVLAMTQLHDLPRPSIPCERRKSFTCRRFGCFLTLKHSGGAISVCGDMIFWHGLLSTAPRSWEISHWTMEPDGNSIGRTTAIWAYNLQHWSNWRGHYCAWFPCLRHYWSGKYEFSSLLQAASLLCFYEAPLKDSLFHNFDRWCHSFDGCRQK